MQMDPQQAKPKHSFLGLEQLLYSVELTIRGGRLKYFVPRALTPKDRALANDSKKQMLDRIA
jgi:hypothetical protein